MPVYLDCNATTPVDAQVEAAFLHYIREEFGNSGSRTHEFGTRAKRAVEKARDQVATVVGCQREEVIFTSGATESNNLAILGLAEHGNASGCRHLITTGIEHKAVLDPMAAMERNGFEVTLLPVGKSGRVDPENVRQVLRADTLLVSVMQANNETGVRQPLSEICDVLQGHNAYLHCDAAQGFGKELEALKNPRLDLISVSGHKLYSPKGIGSLIARKRGFERPPLKPLMFGGGQERGLRPGTLPVALIVALGTAAELAVRHQAKRAAANRAQRERALQALAPLNPRLTGDQSAVMDHVVNLAIPGINSEALMVWLKDLVAVSNGSACTSSSYTTSHVLRSMGFTDAEANECVRLSWCHLTPEIDWESISSRIQQMR